MKIGLCGLGRAGKELIKYISENSEDYVLTSCICRECSTTAGKSISEITNILIKPDIVVQTITKFNPQFIPDVMLDFSSASTTMSVFDLCCNKKINLVICTTNLSRDQLNTIEKKTKHAGIGVIYAPTLTRGINILMEFVKYLSTYFKDFEYEIIEKHPSSKKSPTKTSLYLSESIKAKDIKISSIRLDGYIGIHEIIATDGHERITLEHESFSRSAFVKGALAAAKFLNCNQGFYELKNIYKQVFN